MRILLLLFISLFSISAFSQVALLPNEKALLEFRTIDNDNIVVASDTSFEYIYVKYAKDNKLIFDFPADKTRSRILFDYSYYYRGGGAENEGLDLNYLTFIFENSLYEIYQEYSAVDEKTRCGIKITDLTSGKEKDLESDPATIKGNLNEVRHLDSE